MCKTVVSHQKHSATHTLGSDNKNEVNIRTTVKNPLLSWKWLPDYNSCPFIFILALKLQFISYHFVRYVRQNSLLSLVQFKQYAIIRMYSKNIIYNIYLLILLCCLKIYFYHSTISVVLGGHLCGLQLCQLTGKHYAHSFPKPVNNLQLGCTHIQVSDQN
jgi:hypothetical protein